MNETAEFKGWAKVEVMGHQSHIGFVETQAFGGAVLFRIDRPEIPEVEETLTAWEWAGDRRCGPGSIVKREAIPAGSVLVGAASIYRIVPCDEATALKAIRTGTQRPLILIRLAEQPALPAAEPDDDPFDEDGGEATEL
jgi:hypothetical protein